MHGESPLDGMRIETNKPMHVVIIVMHLAKKNICVKHVVSIQFTCFVFAKEIKKT